MRNSFTNRIGFEYVRDMLECCSPYGTERVRKLEPYTDERELIRELDNIYRAIDSECDAEKMERIRMLFMQIKDIRRSIQGIGEGALDEVSLFEIKRFLLQLAEIKTSYEELSFDFEGVRFDDCSEALSILCIDGNCTAGFYISDNYSQELKCIRAKKHELEHIIRKLTGNEAEKMKLERLEIVDREETEETRIRYELSHKLIPYKQSILNATYAIGTVDLIFAKARLAKSADAVMPHIRSGGIELVNMRNPAIEQTLSHHKRKFTPVSIRTDSGSTVITGANMGGKSVALKTLALNAYVAMCGMFVFCDKAYVPHLSGIAMIAEDSEDVENGLSTFGGEIIRLKNELKNTDKCVLLLFDEPAKGTNPQEGARIVQAMVRYLNTKPAISVFATHYDGISNFAKRHYRVIGLRDFDFEKATSACGIELMADQMNYGLYEAAPDEKCPREAIGICKMLLRGEELLDVLLSDE